MKRFFIITGIFVSAIFLFLFTFLLILPSSLIESWLEDGLKKRTGLAFAVEGFQKSLPFGFNIERVNIFQEGIKDPLFTLDGVLGRFKPLSLFSGGIGVLISGSVGKGKLEGEAFFRAGDSSVDIKANNISLPYFDSIGLNKIVFDGQVYTTFPKNGCPSGTIKAEGKDAKAVKINVMGFDVPFGEIKQTGIMIEIGKCKLFLKGLWLEGEGLSARLQGEVSLASPVKDSPISMTLDIIPGQLLRENGLILALISDYRKSANNYSIPIKGTLGSPVMGL